MAIEGIVNSCCGKRKKDVPRKKLQVDEKVEVRSFDDGFQGSWHPGKVIKCDKRKRCVRYENVLADDESNNLVEEVKVSNALDGHISYTCCPQRGWIRPIPPFHDLDLHCLKFGSCVDVNYREGWWEGVIFDRCDGKEERSVFFPDLGDEMKIGIKKIRITQDWNEISEKWKQRQNWVFLELIEECERNTYVAVSAKQIWYDVRGRKDFRMIGDWTSNAKKELWREMVTEVVGDYWTLTVQHICSVLKLSKLESVELMPNAVKNDLAKFQNEISCKSAGEVVSGAVCFSKNEHRSSTPFSPAQWEPVILSEIECCPEAVEQYALPSTKNKAFWKEKVLKHLAYLEWKVEVAKRNNGGLRYRYKSPDERGEKNIYYSLIELCKDMQEQSNINSFPSQNDLHIMHPTVDFDAVPHVLLNPSEKIQVLDDSLLIMTPPSVAAVDEKEYCPPVMQKESNMNSSPSKNDLCIIHPTVDCDDGPHVLLNPLEKIQDLDASPLVVAPPSVRVVDEKEDCPQVMQKESDMNSTWSPNDLCTMHPTVDCDDVPHVLLNPLEKIQDLDASPLVASPSLEKIQDLDDSALVASPSVGVVDKKDYCPQAVVKYYIAHTFEKKKMSRADKSMLISKAKNHLLAEGWNLVYPPEHKKRMGIRYYTPKDKKFHTLHEACRFCIEESIPKWTISLMQPLNVPGINGKKVDQVLSEDFLRSLLQLLPEEPDLHTTDSVFVNRSTGNQKRKHLRDSKASPTKRKSNRLPTRVVRTHKRVQSESVSGLSHQKPLSVLSWMIDSNMVLPRSKVYYCVKKRKRLFRGEGRITRDGIRCKCCQEVYGLAGFGRHVSGSESCTPCSSIMLEDGRSLLEVQRQVMEDHKSREIIEKPSNNLCQPENDYVCSVCHYGGELILCDHCPSSFHRTCLCLEDIPDGDWFCPSCRCGICGQGGTNKDEGGGHFLTCTQCEHKYHVTCLENRDIGKARRYMEKWFCGDGCEKVFEGLQRLLGKSISVGADNLTWTLMQFSNSESPDIERTKSDFLVETYSKLKVAVSLMHECFEPLKESSSSRDLVEDVIFSKWSHLNRLNFRGFYTVLLERNEELVSVATIRVYGEKVAEVPLVGTRFKFRRQGMCHILMNELEKKLMQLGVEQLVLPAVHSVVETWTGSFGFTKMTSLERSKILDCNFLDFQDTTMCQKKLLNQITSPDPPKKIDTHDGDKDCIGSAVTDTHLPMVKEKEPSPEVEDQQCQNGTLSQCSSRKWDASSKYYKRRKVKKLEEEVHRSTQSSE